MNTSYTKAPREESLKKEPVNKVLLPKKIIELLHFSVAVLLLQRGACPLEKGSEGKTGGHSWLDRATQWFSCNGQTMVFLCPSLKETSGAVRDFNSNE